MRNIFFVFLLSGLGLVAQASGGSATVSCANGLGSPPVLSISYSPGSDAGVPGLFWLGVLTPGKSGGAVLTPNGWIQYQGGLYPYQSQFQGGLPAGGISMSMEFPDGALTTAAYVGYEVYAGHGVYSLEGQQKVAVRRASVTSARNSLVASNQWNSYYTSDDSTIYAAVQQDMIDGGKYGSLITIPFVDCTPPPPPITGQRLQ